MPADLKNVSEKAKQFTAGNQVGKLHEPVKRGASWVVAIEDVLGERAEKFFSSHSKAMDFYTELWLGMSRTEKLARALNDAEVPPGVAASTADFAGLPVVSNTRPLGRKMPLNLRKVSEVLGQYGLDPSVEIAEILTPIVEIDRDTGVEVERHRLPPEMRANILLELMQYAHPKLKAVEMKIEGTLEGMTQEQIDKRLATLIAKASRE